ncbi:MAG: hypothetical protein JNK05_18015 [Myxococcales bacterium]|nr:hypothetical protein [Myxococcales bacterium]
MLRSIAREGLRGWEHPWTSDVLGHKGALTFVSPTPIASHGGDPVEFAMGYRRYKGARSRGDGWIIVGELPDHARSLVRAVVPNRELELYFEGRDVLRKLACCAATTDHTAVPAIVALEELGRRNDLDRIMNAVTVVGRGSFDDLDLTGVSFATYCAFADELAGANTVEKALRAAKKRGIKWTRPEVMHCELCVAGLASWRFYLPPWVKLACAKGSPVSFDWSYAGRDLFGRELAQTARMVARWFEGAARSALDAAFADFSASKLRFTDARRALFTQLPLDPSRVPRPWAPDFGDRCRDEDLRAPDVQWVCDAIPPEHIRGALRLSSGPRFRPWAKPDKGQTLSTKLWRAARTLAATSTRADTIYDG